MTPIDLIKVCKNNANCTECINNIECVLFEGRYGKKPFKFEDMDVDLVNTFNFKRAIEIFQGGGTIGRLSKGYGRNLIRKTDSLNSYISMQDIIAEDWYEYEGEEYEDRQYSNIII